MRKRKDVNITDKLLEQLQGLSFYTFNDDLLLLKGIPLKRLALIYLFGANILPVSKIIFLAGQTQSCKSALSLYFINEIISYGGYGFYIENENKYNIDFIKNIVLNRDRFMIKPVASVNEWQIAITEILDTIEKQKVTVPIIIVVDSLVGTPSEEGIHLISKEGYSPERSTDTLATARSITNFLRNLTSRLINKNIIVLFTNHMKPPVHMDGRVVSPYEKSTPGGGGQDFHAVLYICSYKQSELIKDKISIGRRVAFRLYKSSISSPGRKLEVDFLWDNVPYKFLWEKALIQLILGDDKLQKIIKLQKISHGPMGLRYTSEPLGIKDGTEMDIEQAILSNPEIFKEFTRIWQISIFNSI